MKEAIKHILYKVSEDVLGKLAFMFSFPEDERQPLESDSSLGASVSFDGPFKGKLVIMISDEVLPELAGNMLGIDEDETTTSEQQYDALKELINVICGNLLPEIAGRQAIFRVETPQIHVESDNGDTPISTAKLSIEDGGCDLHLFIQGEIPQDIIAVISEKENIK